MDRLPVLLGGALAVLVLICGAAPVAGADSRAELTFARVNGQRHSVWVANADGSAARKVAEPAYEGRLSSDGRWLAYSRPQDRPGSGLVPLYVVNLAGGKARRIGEPRGEQWSPDRAKLAITDAMGLFVVEPVSGKRRALVRGRHLGQISFSPDGRAIAYARDNGRVGQAQRSDIFVVKLSDGAVEQLTHEGDSGSPLWGPRWIVYRRFRWGRAVSSTGRLWLMRPDGSRKRLLARGGEGLSRGGLPRYGLDPVALSNDGLHLLACQAFEFSCSPVTVTVPAGKSYGFPEVQALVRTGGVAMANDLSRDGTRVAVDVGPFDDDENHRVYEVPFAGGKLRLLARDAFRARWVH
jgi:Tol biopolymer transport system component